MVASRRRVLYVGVTGDLRRRVLEHRAGMGAGFTARYRCERLVWFEAHADAAAAIGREKELKGWIRAKKVAVVEVGNRTWVDLAVGLFGFDEGAGG